MSASPDYHTQLLGLAGRVPPGWLAVTRSALAQRDLPRVRDLFAALERTAMTTAETTRHTFDPGPDDWDRGDRTAVDTAIRLDGVSALWRARCSATGRVYLVQTQPDADLAALTGALLDALVATGDPAPAVEVFGATTELPAYHRDALEVATLLWTAWADQSVRVAPTFDGATERDGPFFAEDRERVTDLGARQRLLDFLAGGEVVLSMAGALDDIVEPHTAVVPVDFRSDGDWVWTEATRYYLGRHGIAPHPDLAAHGLTRPAVPVRLSHLDRHRVRAALAPVAGEVPLWRAG